MNINKIQKVYTFKSLRVSLETALFCGLMLIISSAKADDTEIFYTENELNNNVLFIMDNSGSMKEKVSGTTTNESDTNTIRIIVSGGNDDAEEFVNGDDTKRKTRTTSGDLGLTYDRALDKGNGSGTEAKEEQLLGLRFDNIKIPNGATITSAHIQFTADENAADISADTATLDIQIQSHDDGESFIDGQVKNIANRNLYTNKIAWNPDPWNTELEKGNAQKTPNLKDIVQLVIDRGGWVEDNALIFVISGTSYRSARSHDSNADDAPVISIEYYEAGEKTRMQVMQDALGTVLTNAPDNLSVGIMNYGDVALAFSRNADNANGVKFPATSINTLAKPIVENSITINGTPEWSKSIIPEPSDTITVRDYISEIADEWEPVGFTPIVDALYEASQYFRAQEVDFGFVKADERRTWGAHPSTYEGDPIEDNVVVNECGVTKNKTIYNDNIANWDSGNTGGIFCPADVNNPSELTSNADYCAATKHNCQSSSDIECTERTPEVTTCSGTDENGTGTGCTTTGGVCIAFGETIFSNSCDYDICEKTIDDLIPPKYVTPMQDGCQSNFIILMSDGKPEYSNGVDTDPKSYDKVKGILNKSSCDTTFGFQSGRCGADLTQHLATNDISTGPNGIDGDQFVNTYVIGFSEGVTDEATNYLQSLVTLEDDPNTIQKEGYFSATNEAELANAFAQALDEIAEASRSQASPGYSVNIKSGLEHEKAIYIPVFDKSSSSVWSGNLKKFIIVNDNGQRKIRGKVTQAGSPTGENYVDAFTELGLFKDDAWDEFSNSTTPDGDEVQRGGTAGLIDDPDARNLYSNLTGDSNVTLTASANHLKAINTGLTKTMLFDETELGLSTADATIYRTELIEFIRGWQGGIRNTASPHGVARKHMGDMLHSEPVVLTYGNTPKVQYIFAVTNEGYLHAFDSSTGIEKFAFMPKELLKNIQPQFTGQGPHLYGIDGSISYHHEDGGVKGVVDGNDTVTIYFGMRRGGRSYYALDVTNIDAPKLKWAVNNSSTGLSRLGQSWSLPYLAKVKHNNIVKNAVIITAGHDPALDYGNDDEYDPASVTTDKLATGMGDDIFILDASNGNLIWSMRQHASTDVIHALPGGVRILDVNRNGLLDRMYFGDTGGNVWRLDLSETLSTSTDDNTLTKLASLGGSGVNSRKFFNEPDVAQLRARGKTVFSVSIGSGLRPHPLNEAINDHMFVLFDESPLGNVPDDFEAIEFKEDDLSKVSIGYVENTGENAGTITKSVTKSSDFEDKYITEVKNSNGDYKRGWYVDFFEEGEKVLAQSVTFDGSLIFTTLVPKTLTVGDQINACVAPSTQGRLYAMNILTGEASIDISKDLTIEDNDIFETISANEIPGSPQQVFNQLECAPAVNGVLGECIHPVDIRIGKKNTQIGSDDAAEIESVYWSDPVE